MGCEKPQEASPIPAPPPAPNPATAVKASKGTRDLNMWQVSVVGRRKAWERDPGQGFGSVSLAGHPSDSAHADKLEIALCVKSGCLEVVPGPKPIQDKFSWSIERDLHRSDNSSPHSECMRFLETPATAMHCHRVSFTPCNGKELLAVQSFGEVMQRINLCRS